MLAGLITRHSSPITGVVQRLLLVAFLIALLFLPGAQAWAGAMEEGDVLLSQHRLQSAVERYAAAALRPGGAGPARIRRGTAYLRRGQWQEAAESFQQAEAGGAASREVLLGLAQARERLGDHEAALVTLRRELELRPGDGEAWISLVEWAAADGKSPEEMETMVANVPTPAGEMAVGQKASYLEGACLLEPDSREGEASLRRAVSGPSHRISALAVDLLQAAQAEVDPREKAISLARVLMGQGLMGPALAYLGRVPEDYPGYSEALALKGHALAVIGRVDQAEVALRRSVELAPEQRIGQFLLGSFLLQRGDADGAADLLVKAARKDPPNPAIFLELADALVGVGDYGSAMQAVKAAVEAEPEGADVRLAAARFYVDRQFRVEEAVPNALEAVRLSGRSAEALSTLGWALHLSGRSTEALPLLVEAVGKDPESPLLRYRLASVEEALGQKEQAREQYLTVRELDGSGYYWGRAEAALSGLQSLYP